jgi:tetratricopeptide (TPR) repeat protein
VEAIGPLKTALRLDPSADIFLHFLAEAYFGLKDYEQAAATLRRRIMRKPDTDVSRVLLASCYGHLGRFEEAKANWQEALRFNPDYSLEHKRRILPYRTSADFEHIVEGLRKAGLPA